MLLRYLKSYICNSVAELRLNAYRFSPEQEPTDEMLEQIMREVAEEARTSNQKATEEHFMQMWQNVLTKQARWAKDIENIRNGHK